MIIHISKSKLFTIDPAKRFAKEYSCEPAIWEQLWRRYKLLEYDIEGLCGYFVIKTGRVPSATAMRRWIVRAEIYHRAQEAREKGTRVVDSSFFGIFEVDVIKEATRHLKFGEAQDSRILL